MKIWAKIYEELSKFQARKQFQGETGRQYLQSILGNKDKSTAGNWIIIRGKTK